MEAINRLGSIFIALGALTSVRGEVLEVDNGSTGYRSLAANEPYYGNVWSSVAQSFTGDARFRYIGFRLLDDTWWMSGSFTQTRPPIRYELYLGENVYTNLIATKTVRLPTKAAIDARWDNDAGFVYADFADVQFITGAAYTLRLVDPNAQNLPIGERSNIGVFSVDENLYSGGRFYYPQGYYNDYFAQYELAFRITPHVMVASKQVVPASQNNQSISAAGVHVQDDGRIETIFITPSPGSECIVSWTDDFRKWFPLIKFQPATTATGVTDGDPTRTSKYYRGTYLPSGVAAAEAFDYPIGSGAVPEQIEPERPNNLYLASTIVAPYERGAFSPNTVNWYNYQDVGSYYSTFGGLHGGEDWNKGGGTNDVGEVIRAVANGQVIDIRPAHSAGASHSGYAVLVRHWLLSGDTVDSLYVHVAADRIGGSQNTNGMIGPESDFSFQEGSPVSKGHVIGVIGAVTSPAMSPHLHFEMRTKQVAPSDLWPNDTGDGYYGPVPGVAGNRSPSITVEEVQSAFLLMQKDGIIDPSDFIDDHR